jgi:SAM-dependent methyltransferase
MRVDRPAESEDSAVQVSEPLPKENQLLPQASDFQYMGSELEIFAHATNWKSYVHSKLHPYLVGDVLEVGAGIGGTTQVFKNGRQRRWVCLEPDSGFAEQIRSSHHLRNCEVVEGMLPDLGPDEKFDSILYMDVLEHIEDDAGELALAAEHLKPNGAIAVLAPALPWLYTAFDEAIGHYRRYTRNSLRAVFPKDMREEECMYLDAFGVLASAGNLLFLQSPAATQGQMRFWDNCLVPISRFADGMLFHSFGRSILSVWRKPS